MKTVTVTYFKFPYGKYYNEAPWLCDEKLPHEIIEDFRESRDPMPGMTSNWSCNQYFAVLEIDNIPYLLMPGL